MKPQLDKATLSEIIVMIDAKVKNLQNAKDIWQEEEHFGTKHLLDLQIEILNLYWTAEPIK